MKPTFAGSPRGLNTLTSVSQLRGGKIFRLRTCSINGCLTKRPSYNGCLTKRPSYNGCLTKRPFNLGNNKGFFFIQIPEEIRF